MRRVACGWFGVVMPMYGWLWGGFGCYCVSIVGFLSFSVFVWGDCLVLFGIVNSVVMAGSLFGCCRMWVLIAGSLHFSAIFCGAGWGGLIVGG